MAGPEPLFGCFNQDCASEISYPANELRLWGDIVTCENCYDWGFTEKQFDDLPPFVPEHEKQIIALVTVVEMLMGHFAREYLTDQFGPRENWPCLPLMDMAAGVSERRGKKG